MEEAESNNHTYYAVQASGQMVLVGAGPCAGPDIIGDPQGVLRALHACPSCSSCLSFVLFVLFLRVLRG